MRSRQKENKYLKRWRRRGKQGHRCIFQVRGMESGVSSSIWSTLFILTFGNRRCVQSRREGTFVSIQIKRLLQADVWLYRNAKWSSVSFPSPETLIKIHLYQQDYRSFQGEVRTLKISTATGQAKEAEGFENGK